ncbi:MAG: sugar ABC transporter permease [Rhodanobacter sp.]|nr:MAG: sugar ABC transporter permease [Rhodanobacter sp.]
MATQQTQKLARILIAPSIILLLLWMIVPLAMTAWFSALNYNLLNSVTSFAGLGNYRYFLSNPAFLSSLLNTLVLVGSVLAISAFFGVLIALLLDQVIVGRRVVRLMLIAPFFVMPTVSALIWKNLLMNPVSGLLAWLWRLFGLTPVDWFTQVPMLSIILIVAWQWLPFAVLILLTALQSLDQEQQEAALMDGAGAFDRFFHLTLPHLARPLSIVILIETIFLLTVFAEIYVTTGGGPGVETTNLAYLIYSQALLQYDVGAASAGGLIAVVLANIAAIFLMRIVGKNLET